MTPEQLADAEFMADAFPGNVERKHRESDQSIRDRELLNLFHKLPPQRQKLVIDLLTDMAIR